MAEDRFSRLHTEASHLVDRSAKLLEMSRIAQAHADAAAQRFVAICARVPLRAVRRTLAPEPATSEPPTK